MTKKMELLSFLYTLSDENAELFANLTLAIPGSGLSEERICEILISAIEDLCDSFRE